MHGRVGMAIWVVSTLGSSACRPKVMNLPATVHCVAQEPPYSPGHPLAVHDTQRLATELASSRIRIAWASNQNPLPAEWSHQLVGEIREHAWEMNRPGCRRIALLRGNGRLSNGETTEFGAFWVTDTPRPQLTVIADVEHRAGVDWLASVTGESATPDSRVRMTIIDDHVELLLDTGSRTYGHGEVLLTGTAVWTEE